MDDSCGRMDELDEMSEGDVSCGRNDGRLMERSGWRGGISGV